MGPPSSGKNSSAQYMALTAALLGWMFDGLEMGLFPLVARPALKDLLGPGVPEGEISRWFAVATASFLIGAATGGVLFGWLGDRVGRVRAMMLSILMYAGFSGACGFAGQPWQIAVLRFAAALGMGGEWSLGVALVMEVWPDRSRAFMAGLIGASANLGYLLIAVLGLGLSRWIGEVAAGLRSAGASEPWVEYLTGHTGWRLLMMSGLTPALLTFFIWGAVPESAKWVEQRSRSSHWSAVDLIGVVFGAVIACGMVTVWAIDRLPDGVPGLGGMSVDLGTRLVVSAVALMTSAGCFVYPVLRFVQRLTAAGTAPPSLTQGTTIRRMLLGAGLGGVALLGTWAATQSAPTWADKLVEHAATHSNPFPEAKAYTQIAGSVGAVLGALLGALLGDWVGRRTAYSALCLGSMAASILFYQANREFGAFFLATAFVAGAVTAAFYGWLPLYLPELFPTAVRASGQGFSFNFGRILAAVGVLQTGNLVSLFQSGLSDHVHPYSPAVAGWLSPLGGYPAACAVMSMVYVVGLVLIRFAPETKGGALPE